MKRRTLFKKLYPSFVYISLISLIAVTVIAVVSFRTFYYDQKEQDLSVQTGLVADEFLKLVQSGNSKQIQELSRRVGRRSGTRFTFILPSGQVLGDSQKNSAEMDLHNDRPEVVAAIQNGHGLAIRRSETLNRDLMYFAQTVYRGDRLVGVVRAAIPLAGIQETLADIYLKVAIGFFFLLALVALSSLWVSQTIAGPLDTIKAHAKELAEGNLSKKIHAEPAASLEVFELGQAINEIAVQLSQKIETITNQKNEQEEIVKKLKILEQHRKEFVANVSHELRTPLTNIQGYTETLLNPAITKDSDRAEYLNIIKNHSTRLSSIIEDLLALSKVEKEADHHEVNLEEKSLLPVLESAVLLCQRKATKRNIDIQLRCDDQLKANINPALMEQAVVNLLDNAIKYGGESNTIKVIAENTDQKAVISVTDQGVGIPKEHQSRLFERFYRVDKARSRQMGGTGLGLAIVKHIALAHNGQVGVRSTPNQGSTFYIELPPYQETSPTSDDSQLPEVTV